MMKKMMIVCMVFLAFGLVYVWAKGDLEWVKKLVARPEAESPGEEVVRPP